MKTLLKKVRLLTIAVIATVNSFDVNGQDMIAPAGTDLTFAALGGTAAQLPNTAIYDNGTDLVYGAVWQLTTMNTVYAKIVDAAGNTPLNITISGLPAHIYRNPDIVIGAVNNSSTKFLVGIIYQHMIPNANQCSVKLNVYQVEVVSGALSITATAPVKLLANASNLQPSHPHIDLINKSNPNDITEVWSKQFVACWDIGVNTGGAIAGDLSDIIINGTSATYITPTGGSASVINTGTSCIRPDIAGIERKIGSNFEDIACFVYTDPTSGAIYTTNWNVSTNTITYGGTFDNGQVPRVDGIDPWTEAGGTNEDFCITYHYAQGAIQQIKTYTPGSGIIVQNTQLAWNVIDNISNSNCLEPQVSCGPGQAYNLSFGCMGNNNALLQTSDWTNTLNNMCVCTTGSTPAYDYFQVNSTTGASIFTANSCSWLTDGVANVRPSWSIVTWYQDVPGISRGIKYKLFNSLGTNPFKPSTTSVNNTKSENGLITISPNPASDILNISGLSNDANYTVTDITGRSVMSGTIKTSSAHIHTNSLTPGMYLLNIDGNEKMKFVKE